jgi:chromosomal replication initiator protein
VPELRTREPGSGGLLRLVEATASPPPPPAKEILESSSGEQTFDTFVVGPQNRFAHAAAKAVAEVPAEEYNPLLILSGPGLGKTHLLAAIAHQVLASRPRTHLISVTAEAFSNDVLAALRENRLLELHERLRTADFLLLDDLQFLSTDPRVQEELFHTFDALRAKHGQVVLASDRPPRGIKSLEERLVTRFLSGLVVEIEPPDLQTKLAILEARLRRRRMELPREILEFVAGRTANNVRELGGALNRLLAYAKVIDRGIDLALAQEVLGPRHRGSPSRVRARRLNCLLSHPVEHTWWRSPSLTWCSSSSGSGR